MRVRLKQAIYLTVLPIAGYLLLVSKPYSVGTILAPALILAALLTGRYLTKSW
jgi:hypothetical protein